MDLKEDCEHRQTWCDIPSSVFHSPTSFRPMKRNFIPFFTLLCLGVASLGANPVLFWNDQVLNATRLSRNPPPIAALHLATYHAAIFDAINGFDRAYEPWLVDEAAPTGADRDAAIAAAAYTVLQAIWGNEVNPRVLRKAYDEALAGIAEGEAKSAGITWGKHVAQRLLDNRSDSGLNQPYAGAITSEKAGKWRETPPAFRPPVSPAVAHVRPFVMKSADQFRAPPPLDLDSPEYAEQLAFTAKVGARDDAERDEYQTLSTPFWADDLGPATPAGHWCVIAQDVARRQELTLEQTAHLFALMTLATADAGISSWEAKFHYLHWRPETALREATTDLNAHLEVKPEFIPNMASPAHPTYTSAHSTFTGAASRMLALYIGTDDFKFTSTSDGLPGVVRSYESFSEACIELNMSRVWGGIHTMIDVVEGRRAGIKIADYVFEHSLRSRK